jgi:SAM-dependent methyltransferase
MTCAEKSCRLNGPPLVSVVAPDHPHRVWRDHCLNFFDEFPLFYQPTRATAPRINRRYHAIIGANKEILAGKTVLDIACFNGRWSFAAIEAGCKSVVGIEGRQHSVDNANENFAKYGIDPSRFRFIRADAISYLRQNRVRADVVLLLGFYYHVDCHVELASLVAATGARHIILDTGVVADSGPMIRLQKESTAEAYNAIGSGPMTLAGIPSREAIELIFGHFGFTAREIDWTPILNEYGLEGVDDYHNRIRATYVLQRTA